MAGARSQHTLDEDEKSHQSSPEGIASSINLEKAEANDGVDANTPLSSSWREEPLSPRESSKVASIIRACSSNDFSTLCSLAGTEQGFVEDAIRRQAWPILLGSTSTPVPDDSWQSLPPHRDEHQVSLDVDRAFVYYPSHDTPAQLSSRRAALTTLIVSVLRTHPSLNYFQGYHDIAQVLLLVLGLPSARSALARLSLLRIRDFMLPSIAGTRSHLDLIPAILYASDPPLTAHLAGLQNFFALSATLTMFAHDVESYGGIARLFDYLLARDAVAGVYMFAALVTLRRDELFDIPADEPEMLYAVLSKLPKPLDLEALVRRAEGLRESHPPEKLPRRAWKGVSRSSVLKTTIPLESLREQTLVQGEKWLDIRAREIESEEVRKAALRRMRKTVLTYRRPASAVLVAVLVGVVSVWLGRYGGITSANSIAGVARDVQRRVVYSVARALGWHTGL
ncbi:hypothetical protein K461DRAFT_277381 [Myriangium duriaei CBS 260.36]|uniref:Rab-GAP TBC domain-containing protein n=1 Tax=Myriangium duriaei CBS 260.36 TaxID=1168546 RepID=A0A9P4MH23_9PEZI|nr:hypothetical protein K461DRAFT_277381 [Myriangium duriaei CBS 260.36]